MELLQVGLILSITFGLLRNVDSLVSPRFEGCLKYFVGRQPPSGFPNSDGDSIFDICQNRNGKLMDVFATLYHSKYKIPLYSAYIMDFVEESGRVHTWAIETDIPSDKQAHNKDYKNNHLFDRGHLCPSIYIQKKNRPAAYVFTNAVPQHKYFNQHSWNHAETTSRKIMKRFCSGGIPYFITGSIPGLNTMMTSHSLDSDKNISTGVSVPTYMFTAACCLHQDTKQSFSFGYMAPNELGRILIEVMDIDSIGRKIKDNSTILQLENPINFFNGRCDTTNKTALKYLADDLNVPVSNYKSTSNRLQFTTFLQKSFCLFGMILLFIL